MGVAIGCGCKEVYRLTHIYYLSPLLLYLFFFTAASLLFVHFVKCFSFFTYSYHVFARLAPLRLPETLACAGSASHRYCSRLRNATPHPRTLHGIPNNAHTPRQFPVRLAPLTSNGAVLSERLHGRHPQPVLQSRDLRLAGSRRNSPRLASRVA